MPEWLKEEFQLKHFGYSDCLPSCFYESQVVYLCILNIYVRVYLSKPKFKHCNSNILWGLKKENCIKSIFQK